MEYVPWTEFPALSWFYDDKQDEESYYWSKEILDLFRPLQYEIKEENSVDTAIEVNDEEPAEFLSIHDVNSDKNQACNNKREYSTINSTTYETLILLTAGVVQQIREDYGVESTIDEGKGGGKTANENKSVVFAVTIPEGPLLPLSVLAVHALNLFFHRDINGQSSYAVMVPMDLDEGKDRNSHILNDACPAFALSVPGKDSEKFQELIEMNKNSFDKNNRRDKASSVSTKILNLVNLVKIARRNVSKIPTSTRKTYFSQFIEPTDNDTTSLQRMVSNLASQIVALSPEAIPNGDKPNDEPFLDKISHIVYTSGTTGRPKGCVSSTLSLLNYIDAKNEAHEISTTSVVLLASALSFDPCLSDILASLDARATLAITPRETLVSGLTTVIKKVKVTHVLCTPTLWSLTLLHRFETPTLKEDFPYLQRVALGGEPIPKSLVQAWARPQQDTENNNAKSQTSPCRLLATYGVTEACVYQTCGEVFSSGPSEIGQCAGNVLRGNGFLIYEEDKQGTNLLEVSELGVPGEIVLFGNQVDACTKYLNRPDLDGKFVAKPITNGAQHTVRYHYRTGDRGCVRNENLVILGRIVGEEGMIKINGVRVELGEIESAILSGESSDANADVSSIVTGCLVNCAKDDDNQNVIHAYCVFRDEIWKELGMAMKEATSPNEGVIINGGPLWTILRTKCSNRLRKACIPSAFIGIRQIPLSRTGKRDRSKLPGLASCSFLDVRGDMSSPLQDYGVAGGKVFETLVQYLNLQPCQQQMVTISVSFAVLGGDSLSAVVVCRTLYAHYHQLQNSRHLGGSYGQLPMPFNTESLLHAKNLGEYVDLIDESIKTNNLSREKSDPSTDPQNESKSQDPPTTTSEKSLLYDALLQATTLDQTLIASALLCVGADPNHGHNHGSRIGNTSGRNQRRAVFKAAPLHLSSFRGNSVLVDLLLSVKASYKSPNTNGLFPIHLAAGGLDDSTSGNTPEEELRRLECVKSLMEAGCPLLMKDANKQSILHAAARAGHIAILEYAIEEHQSDRYTGPVPLMQFLEFQDKWFRSALHWAVLHGHVKAVKILLEKGSDPLPYKPRSNNKQTSMATETPLEICKRLYGTSEKGIEIEKMLLAAIEAKNSGQG